MLNPFMTLAAGLLGLAMTAPAAVRHLETAPGAVTGIQVVTQSATLLELECTIAEVTFEEVTIDGNTWLKPEVSGGAANLEEGTPDLPVLALSFLSGGQGVRTLDITVEDSRVYPDLPIAPSRGNLTRNQSPALAAYPFGEVYSSGQAWPADLCTLSDTWTLRDFQGQSLNIRPFRFEPATGSLEVVSRLRVRLELDPAPNGPPAGSLLDQDFLGIYEQHFVNAGQLRYTYLPAVGSMIVVCADEFLEGIQPFVASKLRSGRPTSVVPISETGSTALQIKAWLLSRYLAEPFSYVLLVGDHAQLPSTLMGSGPNWAADNQYGLLVGADSYPEAIVGRFSVETVEQLQVMVNRNVTYEESPVTEAAWYTRAIGIASAETGGSGGGDDGESDVEHIENVRTTLLAGDHDEVLSVYDTDGGTTSTLLAYLNTGSSVVNYAGHGTFSRWQSPVVGGSLAPGWTFARINSLQNTEGWPVIMSVACDNGKFMEQTCFAEAWLRANQSGNPTGAVAIYAASSAVGWNPPMEIQDEFNHLLGNGTTRAYGALCINGGLSMLEHYLFSGPSQLSMFQVFGDPSLRIRTQPPRTLSVTHENTYSPQQGAFSVLVAGEPGARVALTVEGELASSGITDEDGRAILNLPSTGAPVDLLLVVSADNASPYQAVIPQNQPPFMEMPIGTRMAEEDTAVQLDNLGAHFSDADGDTISITAAEAVATGFTFEFNATDLTIISPPNWNGSTGITVYFTDGHYIVDAGFTLQMTPVNDAPQLVVPFTDLATAEDTGMTIPSPLGHFSDPDGDTVTLLAATSDHGSFVWNGTTLTFTPQADYSGLAGVTLTISDGIIPVQVDAFSIAVSPVNDAPAYNGAYDLLQVHEDSTLMLGNLLDAFTDVEGDPLTLLEATVSPGTLEFDNGLARFVPPADFFGASEIFLRAGDGEYEAESGAVILIVMPVPDAPRLLETLPNRAMDEDSSLLIDNLLDFYADGDGDSLFIASATASAGTLQQDGNTLTLTPAADFNGSITVTFSVSDGGLELVDQQFEVLVLPVDDQLVLLQPFEALVWNEDGFTALTDILSHFHSTDSDTLFITQVTASPEEVQVTAFADSLALSSAVDWHGSGSVFITVDDGQEHPLTVELPLAVIPVNDTPWLSFCNSATEPVTDPETFLDSLGVRLADVDGDALVLEWYFNDELVAQGVHQASADTTGCMEVPEELYALTGDGVLYLQVGDGTVILNEGGAAISWTFVTSSVTEQLPGEFALEPNYPNPFNPATRLPLSVPRDMHVKVLVYNLQGQRVQVLHDGPLAAGRHTLEWNAGGHASGIYLAVLESDGLRQVRRMSLVR